MTPSAEMAGMRPGSLVISALPTAEALFFPVECALRRGPCILYRSCCLSPTTRVAASIGRAYGRVRSELSCRYGGITSFTRAPAEGMWKEGGHTNRDDIVVFEVMTRDLDHTWWERYRADLEDRFQQEAIVMRAIKVEML